MCDTITQPLPPDGVRGINCTVIGWDSDWFDWIPVRILTDLSGFLLEFGWRILL